MWCFLVWTQDLKDPEMSKTPLPFSPDHEKINFSPHTINGRLQAGAVVGIYWLGITFLLKLFVWSSRCKVSLKCLIIAALIILNQWAVNSQLSALVITLFSF